MIPERTRWFQIRSPPLIWLQAPLLFRTQKLTTTSRLQTYLKLQTAPSPTSREALRARSFSQTELISPKTTRIYSGTIPPIASGFRQQLQDQSFQYKESGTPKPQHPHYIQASLHRDSWRHHLELRSPEAPSTSTPNPSLI